MAEVATSMDQVADSLFGYWELSLGSFGYTGPETEPVFTSLLKEYRAPFRFYHTDRHILHFLTLLDNASAEIHGPAELVLAAFYHDCVYVWNSFRNEELSAARARKELSLFNLPADALEKITGLILATELHDTALSSSDTQIFLDADLAILGADKITYREYSLAIRREYQAVPEDIYRSKRKQFLQSLLRRETIYRTEEFRNTCEERARENLKDEIYLLSSDG